MTEALKYRLLDYHYQAFQAHSKAQKFYLLALAIFPTYAWASYLFGAEEVLNPQWVNVRVTKQVLVSASPVVIAALLFGLMGAINRAGESFTRFQDALNSIEPNSLEKVSLYTLDLHPNLLDYAANLIGKRTAQLLYPGIQALGMISIVSLGAIASFQYGPKGTWSWIAFVG